MTPTRALNTPVVANLLSSLFIYLHKYLQNSFLFKKKKDRQQPRTCAITLYPNLGRGMKSILAINEVNNAGVCLFLAVKGRLLRNELNIHHYDSIVINFIDWKIIKN